MEIVLYFAIPIVWYACYSSILDYLIENGLVKAPLNMGQILFFLTASPILYAIIVVYSIFMKAFSFITKY